MVSKSVSSVRTEILVFKRTKRLAAHPRYLKLRTIWIGGGRAQAPSQEESMRAYRGRGPKVSFRALILTALTGVSQANHLAIDGAGHMGSPSFTTGFLSLNYRRFRPEIADFERSLTAILENATQSH